MTHPCINISIFNLLTILQYHNVTARKSPSNHPADQFIIYIVYTSWYIYDIAVKHIASHAGSIILMTEIISEMNYVIGFSKTSFCNVVTMRWIYSLSQKRVHVTIAGNELWCQWGVAVWTLRSNYSVLSVPFQAHFGSKSVETPKVTSRGMTFDLKVNIAIRTCWVVNMRTMPAGMFLGSGKFNVVMTGKDR